MRSENLQVDEFDDRAVGGLEANGTGLPGMQGFDPAGDADAPAVTGCKPGKIPLWSRSGQVVPGGQGEFKKFGRDLRAHRVQPDITGAGTTIAVAIEPGAGRGAADSQRLAKDIGGHGPANGTKQKKQPASHDEEEASGPKRRAFSLLPDRIRPV